MLRADGWRVEFLGADTPVDAAVAFAERIGRRRCSASARRETSRSTLLRDALAALEPAGLMVIVVGGAAMTPEIAGELEATYADARARPRGRAAAHVRHPVSPWLRPRLAGARAAAVWGLVEPIDRRLFRVPLLGHRPRLALLVTRGPHWRAVGWARAHRQRGRRRPRLLGPLRALRWQRVLVRRRVRDGRAPRHLPADDAHRPTAIPARGAPELPPMSRSGRAFAQATLPPSPVRCRARRCSCRSSTYGVGCAVREATDDGDDAIAHALAEAA